MTTTPVLDALVIGGGQAGLAAGYYLKQRGASFAIADAGTRTGDSWRNRYASLTLFTPRAFSALPGLPLSGDADGYATRDEFADYLDAYARRWPLPVEPGTRVRSLARSEAGHFIAESDNGRTFAARTVIVATGPFVAPVVPAFYSDLDASVMRLDATSYRQATDVPAGTTLVIGDGASGRDIAMDLAPTHRVLLATGKPRRLLRPKILGRSIWWWLSTLGLLKARPGSLVGRFMRKADPFPDRNRSTKVLKSAGISIKPRAVSATRREVRFADGTAETVNAVIASVGYRDDFGWLHVPGALDDRGSPLHAEGVSPVSGLFFIGRPWQRNRASALIYGAGDDARIVVESALGSDRRSGPAR